MSPPVSFLLPALDCLHARAQNVAITACVDALVRTPFLCHSLCRQCAELRSEIDFNQNKIDELIRAEGGSRASFSSLKSAFSAVYLHLDASRVHLQPRV